MPELEDVLTYDIKTAAASFRHYLLALDDGSKIFCISQKDNYDSRSLVSIIDLLKDNLSSISSENNINLINAPLLDISEFDMLCVLDSKAHAHFKHDIPELYPHTYVIFPCHHSEFLESDSLKDIRYLRTKSVSTLNWDRKISPKVWLWFDIYSTGQETHSTKLEISSFCYLENLLNNRMSNESGLVKVGNYTGSTIEITLIAGKLTAFNKAYDTYESLRGDLWLWLTQ